MNRAIAIPLACLASLALGTVLAAEDAWSASVWEGKPAFTATVGLATAIVSPAFGRLVWFGPKDGRNLLYVPPGGSIAVGGTNLHGGHQIWLGPQERWTWPPAPGWEGAGTATAASAVLTISLPASAGLPGLERTYRIDGDILRCGVRWQDPRGWQAMHVLQVPRTMQLTPLFAPATPEGSSFVSGYNKPAPPAGLQRDGDSLAVTPETANGKIFAPAQLLRASSGGWTIELDRVEIHGKQAGPAERGLPTQVYISPPEMGYFELEQCSILLEPASDGWAGATFALRLSSDKR